MYFLRTQDFVGIHFPGVQDFTAQRQDGLEFTVAGLLGRAAGGIPFHQKQFAALAVLTGTVGQFAGQCWPLGDFLASHGLGFTQPCLGAGNGQLGNQFGFGGVLVQPQREGIFYHAGNKAGGFTRRQTLFGLAGKLRVGELGRQHIGAAFPDVFRGEFDAARQQIAEFAELAQGIQQAGAETVHVGTALSGRNQVDVAFLQQLAAVRQPVHCPVHPFGGAGHGAAERLSWQYVVTSGMDFQVILEAIFVVPLGAVFSIRGVKADTQARAQYGFGAQHVLQAWNGKFRRVEVFRVGQETHAGAGFLFRAAVHHLQIEGFVAVFEADARHLTIAPDGHFQHLRQRVNHRHTHAVQTTGKLIVVVGEFTTGVQLAEDQLDPGDAVLRVNIGRHTAAVVQHRHGAIAVQCDFHIGGMPCQRFVHGVVDHFLRQMVGAGGVGVHPRAFTDGVETT